MFALRDVDIGGAPNCIVPNTSLVILTDGLCGSTCSQFLSAMRGHNMTTNVVLYGGLNSGTNLQTSNVAGGFIISDINSIGRVRVGRIRFV